MEYALGARTNGAFGIPTSCSNIKSIKPLRMMNYAERNGGLKGQQALSPGQRPGFLIKRNNVAPKGQKPYTKAVCALN